MKQNVNINFSQGVNTKTDPWQLSLGQFESLKNSIFQIGGLLSKRPGYGLLTSSNPDSTYMTTLNTNLISIGSTVNAYSQSLNSWISKGTLQPCTVDVLPLIRNNVNEVQSDTAIANGLVLTTYTETYSTDTGVQTSFFYAIADKETGQNIVEPSSIPVLSTGVIQGSSRVFVVGNFFVIVSPVTVSGTIFLQYVSIPILNPVNSDNTPNVSAAAEVTSNAYISLSTNPGWDGVSAGGTLVLAYNTTTGGQGVHVATLTSQQISNNDTSSTILAFTNAVYKAGMLSMTVDQTVNPNVFYGSFWNPTTTNAYTFAVTIGFGTITQVFVPTLMFSSVTAANISSAAQNGSCLVFLEANLAYGYDSLIPTNNITARPITQAGSPGSAYTAINSVGLASKAFIIDETIYFLSAYQSPFQPTYFLINGSLTTIQNPIVVAKLAYQNGAGYVTRGLPSVFVDGTTAEVSYLYKDDVEALNTQNNTQLLVVGGIYSQLGINLATFDISTKKISACELANNLHISGGFLGQFDGYLPVEHNFFLWPDSVECTYTAASAKTPTGTALISSNLITLNSPTGVFVGMTITNSTNPTYIPAGTTILFINGSVVTISANTTHAFSGDSLSIQGNIAAIPSGGTMGAINYYYQVTYEWTDNQGLAYRSTPSIPVAITTSGSGTAGTVTINVPTLRLTYKIANPPKIVIYRWSVNTQVYNQVTSIDHPILNDTTIQYVTFVDTLPDASVVGNNILYTTGGVLPDVNAPASRIMTLFNSSLCLVPSENPNTLWIGKQVIQNTPVEMSINLSIYISPTLGTVESLGPVTAIFPMDDKIIIFFQSGIYYVNGQPPPITGLTSVGCSLGNYSQPIFITSVVGCTNTKSIVLTPDGLMFQSDKGIWLLNRYSLKAEYVGAPVEAFNDLVVNSVNLIPNTNYIVFTLTDTNIFLMYDYFYSQWGLFEGVYGVSSCIFENLHVILDKYGNILRETPNSYLDNENPVLMSFKTGWLNLASLQGYQRFYEMHILAKYLSPHSLVFKVAYNYNPSVLNQVVVTPNLFSPSIPSPFGVPTPYGSGGQKEQWRIHAKQQLCESVQLTMEEIFNPLFQTIPGAGFTMSGINATVEIKKATRPIPGKTTAGFK